MDQKVEDVSLREGISLDELVQELEAGGGFTGKGVGVAVNILEEMIRDKDCVNFLSFPACISATGCRGVIRDLIKRELVDVVVTTCGTLDHDLARSWSDYYHGDFDLDDVELHREKINRIGNILAPNESYGLILEEKMQPILNEFWEEGKKESGARELAWEFGKRLDEDSILYWAQKNKIPVFVPGLMDGAFGSQLWLFWQEHRDFRINPIQDEEELSEIVFNAKKSGGLIVGGGISKHHTIWWNSFKDGLDYAVYITTSPEYDGSLSGAKPREAISWGKIKEKAPKVSVEGDATVLLPLIVGALIERL